MISLHKFSGSCNSVDNLSTKICVPSKTKGINVKVFNKTTRKMKLKQWQNIFNVITNANSIVQIAIQIKNRTMKHVNVSVKIIVRAKRDYSWSPSICICENDKYLKSVPDDSKNVYHEIINVMGIVSTNVANTISTNVSTNSDDKEVKYKTVYYVFHRV